MKSIRLLFIMAIMFFCIGCNEDIKRPLNEDSEPQKVFDISVENINGGAVIKYTLPKDENLLYVKAVYSIRDGYERETKASYFKTSLTVDGFPTTDEYEVKLYSVSRGEKESEPVIVKVNPLTPPVLDVFENLTVSETFGGIVVHFKNDSESDVVLNVLTEDAFGDMVPRESYYTSKKEGSFSARGFDGEMRTFGLFVKDRWNNRSDTIYTELTPLFEVRLNKGNFKEVQLLNDTYLGHGAGIRLDNLWDDMLGRINGNIWHSVPGSGIPQSFTIDLGVTAKLSRFSLHHRTGAGDGPYKSGDTQIYEIWGSNSPSLDGNWDNWTKIMTCESVKPSGSSPDVTPEDVQFATVDGEGFDIPEDTPAFRYLRFRVLKTWGNVTFIYLAELTFWGSAQ